MLFSLPRSEQVHIVRAKVEANEDPLGVGEAADDLVDGLGKFSHGRWHGQDLVALRKLRIFHEINDIDVVAASEILFAALLETAKGGDRFGLGPGAAEPQIPIHGRSYG